MANVKVSNLSLGNTQPMTIIGGMNVIEVEILRCVSLRLLYVQLAS